MFVDAHHFVPGPFTMAFRVLFVGWPKLDPLRRHRPCGRCICSHTIPPCCLALPIRPWVTSSGNLQGQATHEGNRQSSVEERRSCFLLFFGLRTREDTSSIILGRSFLHYVTAVLGGDRPTRRTRSPSIICSQSTACNLLLLLLHHHHHDAIGANTRTAARLSCLCRKEQLLPPRLPRQRQPLVVPPPQRYSRFLLSLLQLLVGDCLHLPRRHQPMPQQCHLRLLQCDVTQRNQMSLPPCRRLRSSRVIPSRLIRLLLRELPHHLITLPEGLMRHSLPKRKSTPATQPNRPLLPPRLTPLLLHTCVEPAAIKTTAIPSNILTICGLPYFWYPQLSCY